MNLLIKSQRAGAENAEEYGLSEQSAAPGAAVSAETNGEPVDAAASNAANQTAPLTGHDADLSEVADRWATLPGAVRMAVMALVRSVSR